MRFALFQVAAVGHKSGDREKFKVMEVAFRQLSVDTFVLTPFIHCSGVT